MQTGTDPAAGGGTLEAVLDFRDPGFHSQAADYLLLNYM
jgi:hypothetical protein